MTKKLTSAASRLLAIESYVAGKNILIAKHFGEPNTYVGRIYECSPITGGGEELEVFISSIFKTAPDDSVLQVNLIVGPDFDTPAIYRYQKTHGSEMVQELVKQRAELARAAATTEGALPDLVVSNFKKLIISFAIPGKEVSPKNIADFVAKHDDFYMALKGSGFTDAESRSPEEVIGIYRQAARMFDKYSPAEALDPALDLKRQVFTPADHFDFEALSTITLPGANCTAIVPKIYAEELTLGVANLLIGAPFNEGPPKDGGGAQRIQLPHIISATVRLAKQEREHTRLVRALRSREDLVTLPEMFRLGEETSKVVADLVYMKDRIDNHHDKYTKASLTYLVFSKEGSAESEARLLRDITTIKNLLNYQDFDAAVVEDNTGVRWAQSLPLNYSRRIAEKLDNEVDMPSSSASALLPVYGNWRGNANKKSSGSLFWTPRGEPFFFDPFCTNSNMNGSITAQPGAGKGVVCNQLIIDNLAAGNFVAMIDHGNSYRKLCNLADGDYITFDLENNKISLNPFSGLTAETFGEEEETIAGLMLKMACFTDIPTDWERTAMLEAVRAAWKDDDGRNADKKGIESVVEALEHNAKQVSSFSKDYGLAETEKAARNLAAKLRAFSENSRRNSFFSGPSNLKSRKQFVVVELSGLGADPHLMEVVLFYVLNRILGWVTGTVGRKFIGIDESWEIIAKETAVPAIEGLYRKARKDGGSIWVITQSPLDLEANAAGRAIRRSTNWNLVLEQKADSIQELIEKKHWANHASDPYFERMLRDTKTQKGKYSEMMIITDSAYEKVRHYLNPFMLMVYNTEQEERDAVFALMNQGLTAIEAVERVANNFTISRRLWLERQVKHLIHNEGYDAEILRREIDEILDTL